MLNPHQRRQTTSFNGFDVGNDNDVIGKPVSLYKDAKEPGVVSHTYNSSTRDNEAGAS